MKPRKIDISGGAPTPQTIDNQTGANDVGRTESVTEAA
jgi:hypothetical protein